MQKSIAAHMAFTENLKTFLEHYKGTLEAKQNGDESVQKEFATLKAQANKLKQEKQYAATAGEKSCNIKKNRYKDILPFDKTRFVLETTESSPDGSDYINANYIEGTKDEHAYIAAQGPLPSTVNDFWRLLWECGGSIIIMACNEYEMGKTKAKQHKCERYWADKGEEKTFGEITVSLVESEISKRDFCLRKLKVMKGKEEKLFHQFHYTAWPDHGVPDTVTTILELVRQARELQPNEKKPFIVHCSAGCGRTGTIIALDYVSELLKSQKISADFSLYNIIFNMRKQRPAIVQTKEQYEFVHKAVSELFKHELSNQGEDYGHNYENVQIGPIGTSDKPRRPPTPTLQVKRKSGETQATRKLSGQATTPVRDTDPTVYANSDDLKKRPNSSPALVPITPRDRSDRDIKIMDQVEESVADQRKVEPAVTTAKPKIPGKPNQSDGRRVSGGPTSKVVDKNSHSSSKEGGQQPAHVSSGTGKPHTSLPPGGGKPPTPSGNVKPSVPPGKGLFPPLANRVGQLNVSHMVHSSTNGGKVSPAIKESSSRPAFQPPKPPVAKGSNTKTPVVVNNARVAKGSQSYEEVTPNPSAAPPRKPGAALRPPPSPGGIRPKSKPPGKESGWANNVVYKPAVTAFNPGSGSTLLTNAAYESVGASVKNSEYEDVDSSDSSKTFIKPTESNSSVYEDVKPRSTNPSSTGDYAEAADLQQSLTSPLIPTTGNVHHGGLTPSNPNRSSVTSIKSNVSTGSREESPSREFANNDHDVGAPVVPVRTADSYVLIDDRGEVSNQRDKPDSKPFNTIPRLINKMRPRIPFASNNDNVCPPANTAVVQQVGQTNHNSRVPVFPNRGPKPVGPRNFPQVGRGQLRTLPT